MQALRIAAESGNWDLDNIGDSLINIIRDSGFDGTIPIDIGDTTLYISGTTMTVIDWTDANTEEVLKNI